MRTVFMAATMIAAGQIAIAQDAPAPSAPPPETPSDSDSQAAAAAPEPVIEPIVRDEKFVAAFTEAKRLQSIGKYTEAYAQYIALARKWPEDPDVLLGIGECGVAAAVHESTDPAMRRKMLNNARAAYYQYTKWAEHQTERAGELIGRIRTAREWMSEIVAEIARTPSVASVVATPPAPAPRPATPPMPATPSVPVAVASTAAPRGPPRGVIPDALSAPAATPGKAAAPASGPASAPAPAPDASPEAAPEQQADAVAEDDVPPAERLKCLASRGLLTAQFVSGADGQFTMRLRPPSNWESIPCSTK